MMDGLVLLAAEQAGGVKEATPSASRVRLA